MNPNKTVKRIEKIEKEICGVFDLVLIFGCSACGLCSKFMDLIFGLGLCSKILGSLFFSFFFFEIIDNTILM